MLRFLIFLLVLFTILYLTDRLLEEDQPQDEDDKSLQADPNIKTFHEEPPDDRLSEQ